MQLLDDDMDELFRKAASQYPLKTDGMDWDALDRRLRPENGAMPPPVADAPKPARKWFWWRGLPLLLLFMGAGIFWMSVRKGGTQKQTNNTAQKAIATNITSRPIPIKTSTPSAEQGAVQEEQPIVAEGLTLGNSRNVKKQKTAATLTHMVFVPVTYGGDNKEGIDVSGSTTKHENLAGTRNANGVATGTTNGAITATTGANGTATGNANTNAAIAANTRNGIAANSGDRTTAHSSVPIMLDTLRIIGFKPIKEERPGRKKNEADLFALNNWQPAISPVKDTLLVTQVSPGTPKANIVVNPGLYAGVLVSPDFTTIKGQTLKAGGYNLGVVLGYRISKRFAVEAGVSWDRKNYYSKGEYFSTSKLPNAQNYKIISIDGWCNMIEIPVNVRYFFSVKEKASWYANAGLSSYLMKTESYNYDMLYNGGGRATKNYSYNNSSKDWLSVVHLGVGYERKLSKVGTIRLEPYLNLPAGGLGVGKLPMTSFGLNIGITRSIRW